MRIQFEEIKLKATRRWKENGKRRRETKTFSQTINPFNRDEAGNVKTREQIWRELHEAANEWTAVQ